MSRHPYSTPRHCSLVIIACLLCVWLSIGGTSAAPTDVTIENSTIHGDGVIATENNITYLEQWNSSTISMDIAADSGVYRACVEIGDDAENQSLNCKIVEISTQTATITLALNTSAPVTSGQQPLSVFIRNSTDSDDELLLTETQQVTLLPAGGDFDDDGLDNKRERALGTDFRTADSDGDDLTDDQEVNIYHTEPLQRDTDGDGLADGIEVNKHETNPTVQDTDGDGLSDAAEVNIHGTDPTMADTDGDGLSDRKEIQRFDTNPTTKDTDGDGLLDGRERSIYKTDPTIKDTDGDGLTDGAEVNKHETNPTDPDTDGDGLNDGAEIHKYNTDPKSPDTDGDGIDDATEIRRGTNPIDGITGVLAVLQQHLLLIAGLGGTVGLGIIIGYLYRTRIGIDAGDEMVSPNNLDTSASSSTASPAETTATARSSADSLTDTERIQQVLTNNGGRIQQSEIVEQTEWSKSKVSRLLSKMDDENQITKISIGRENLITRPGDEPKNADTTFKD